MMYWFVVFVFIYIIGGYFSPFPYWPTYFTLLKNVLLNKEKRISYKTRIQQIKYLLKYLVFCPIWAFLWYLDKFLFPYNQQCVKPIFIIGEPRSGTTFLHRTLANDQENFFAIRHFEWRYPYITIQKLIAFLGFSEKFKNKNYWPNNETGRKASKMHANTLYDWEEDGIFFEECFLHHFFIFLRFPYSNLLTYLDDFTALPHKSQKRMLRIHQEVIQKMMYLKGSNKVYLSKEVMSQKKIDWILHLYPEAKFIVSFRKSSDFMTSVLALIQQSTLSKAEVDLSLMPEWESIFTKRMQQDGLMLLHLINNQLKEKTICLSYNLLMTNIVLSFQSIYNHLGISLSDSNLQFLNGVENKQKQRTRDYSLDEKCFDGFEFFDISVEKFDKEHKERIEASITMDLDEVYKENF